MSSPDADTAQIAATSTLRRLGHLLASTNLPASLSHNLGSQLSQLISQLQTLPRRSKAAEYSGPQPAATPVGKVIKFDHHSIVAGPRNPFGMGAVHRRISENEVLTTVVLHQTFEGPPARAHGGVIAALMDESTASVLIGIGRAAFTVSLDVKLKAAAPLDTELKFTSTLVRWEGRKAFVNCVGKGPEGVFAECNAMYVEVDRKVMQVQKGKAGKVGGPEQQARL